MCSCAANLGLTAVHTLLCSIHAHTVTHTHTSLTPMPPGDLKRVVYGVDSYGFTCGSKTNFRGDVIDLEDSTNL